MTANTDAQPVPRPKPQIGIAPSAGVEIPNHLRRPEDRISVRRPDLDFQGPDANRE